MRADGMSMNELEMCIHQHPILTPANMAYSRAEVAKAPRLTEKQIAALVPLLNNPETRKRIADDQAVELTAAEAAPILGVTAEETRALVRSGLLRASGTGSRIRVTHLAIDEYIYTLDTVCDECGGRRAFRRRVQSPRCVTDSELADPNGRRPEWMPKPRRPRRTRGGTTQRPTRE